MRKNLVLDPNVFRRPELLAPAIQNARSLAEYLVVPDIAFAEMTKSPEWQSTARASLRPLAEVSILVVVGRPIGPLMAEECLFGTPRTDVMDLETS